MLNQARLKVLKVREDHVRNVLEDARKRLGDVTRDQGRYREILESLILQGLYQVGRKKFIENFLSIFFSMKHLSPLILTIPLAIQFLYHHTFTSIRI